MNPAPNSWRNPGPWIEFLCWIGILYAFMALLPSFWVPIGLPHEGDSLNYRIPILKWMLRHHSYPNWEFTYIDDYPMLGELLLLPFFAVSETFARLVPMLFYFLTALFATKIALQFVKTEAHQHSFALVVFFSVLGLHPLLLQSNILMVDGMATAMTLASLHFCLRGKPLHSGIFLGIAMASRYSIWGVLIGALLANGLQRKNKRDLFLFLFPILILLSPFIARNWIYNGNPIYPIFSEFINGQQTFSFDQWGRGKGLIALLLFPYDLFVTNSFHSSIFDTRFPFFDYYIFTVGWGLQITLATALIVLLWQWKKIQPKALINSPSAKIIAFYFLSHFIYWWVGSQQLRFFVFELTLILVLLLAFLYNYGPKILLLPLVIISFYSITNVHRESWNIATGKSVAYQDLPFVKNHRDCLGRLDIGNNAIIGHNKADTFLGFGNYDFVFLPPHPYAVTSSNTTSPDYLFDGTDKKEIPGYQRWPYQKPCVWKKIGDL